MKIGYIYDAVYPYCKGGGERRIYEIATRLSRKGHDVHILGMKFWEGDSIFRQDGLTYHGLAPEVPLYHPSGRRSIREALHFGLHSVRLLKLPKFDVMDCGQWPYFHFFAARTAGWLRSSAFVVSWYEVWGRHWFQYLGAPGVVGLAAERYLARVPDKLIAVSDLTKHDLLRSGVKNRKVEMIPNGIAFKEIVSIPAPPKNFDIVCLGRLKNHKNVDVILHAVALLKRHRPGVSALIIGEGPERERLEELAAGLGIQPNVTFTGGIESFTDMIRMMKSARVFVNMSTKEGGGSITLFEANACGLPVIAVRCPNGIDPSLIEDGRNGYFLPELSAELLAAKVTEVLDSPELLGRLEHQCVAMAAPYDWDTIADRHELVYLSCHGVN